MPSRDFDDFCATVRKQIRSPYARAAVARELTAHLEDHAAALTEAGTDPQEAELRAVRAMGDPVVLGRDFDRLHSPVGYYLFLAVRPVAVLAVFLCLCVLAEGKLNTGWYTQDTLLPRLFPTWAITQVLILPSNEYAVATGSVTGGGRYGDYRVIPCGRAALLSIDGTYDLLFAVATAHWQPWLDDLSFDNITLASDAPRGWLYQDSISHPHPSRLINLRWIRICDVNPEVRDYVFSLGAGEQVLQFQVALGGDET